MVRGALSHALAAARGGHDGAGGALIRRLPSALAAALGVALACGDDGSGPGGGSCADVGATVVVNATDSRQFVPATVNIEPGQSVCWQNTGTLDHTVTSDDGFFNRNLGRGTRVVLTFIAEGAYGYHCTPHAAQGMAGAVNVGPVQ